MTRRLHWPLWLLLFTLFELPAQSCGPDYPVAIFTKVYGPDSPYERFAAGRLGVLRTTFRDRHLVLAYDYLIGRALTPAEQKQAIAAHQTLFDDSATYSTTPSHPGFDRWIAARTAFGPVDGYVPTKDLVTDAEDPNGDYGYFTNCLDGAFATAADTLAARAKSYAAQTPNITEWVRGQDAVFTNCAGDRKPLFSGQNLPPKPLVPKPLANAPAWLAQDRQYQLAATKFYALGFDGAIAAFRAIASDKSSPWSATSRYVIVRALIRKATLSKSTNQDGTLDASQKAQLTEAEKYLIPLLNDPAMQSWHSSLDGLHDFLAIRLSPASQTLNLATRLTTPKSKADFNQSLIDFTYLRVHAAANAVKPDDSHLVPHEAVDMLQWLGVIERGDEAEALKHWRATPTKAWLVAALACLEAGSAQRSVAEPGTAKAGAVRVPPELLAAAAKVPLSDPAGVTVAYARLRLTPPTAETRKELLALQPAIEKEQGYGTANLFAALNSETAPTLDEWLAQSARLPATDTSWGSEGDTPITHGDGKLDLTRRFTDESSAVMNYDMPAALLATAAASASLPKNLQFDVAQAAWTRAVILDKPEVARKLSPILIAAYPAWQQVLGPYDDAKTADDRKAFGLLALMRFASTEPNIRGGYDRGSFATYSEFRDNWWASIPPGLQDGSGKASAVPNPVPVFLTQQQLTEARAEFAGLAPAKVAANYFAAEALAWQKAHPRDPRSADILGEALRVERNANGDKATPQFAHKLFDVLHQQYPASKWAKQYTTWE